MKLTQQQKNTLKIHLSANTNVTEAIALDGSTLPTPFIINTQINSGDAEKERAIADWYNRNVTGLENQPFATPNELWKNSVLTIELAKAIDWGNANLIPHGLGGSPTTTEIYIVRNYKMLLWQVGTWDGVLDLTDGQQRALVFNTFGNSAAGNTTEAVASVGIGRRTPTRIERLYAGNAVGQAGIGGTIGRVCPLSIYGQTISQDEMHDAILNGVAP